MMDGTRLLVLFGLLMIVIGGLTLRRKPSAGDANVRLGRDYTLYATVDGVVKYERLGKDRKKVSVYPQAPASA